MAQMTTCYAPDGTEHRDTVANCRDLVLHSGYSFERGKEFVPTDHLPAKIKRVKKATPAVQEVWENHGVRPGTAAPTSDDQITETVEEPEALPLEATEEDQQHGEQE